MAPGLTAPQQRKLATYVRQIADALKLRDWQIIVANEPIPSTSGTLASCSTAYGRRCATISFHVTFAALSPEIIRETVVHELLHCYLNSHTSLYGVRDLIGESAWTVLAAAVHRETEYATDAIASAIAGFFPLPPTL